MDWTESKDGVAEARAADGARWVLRDAETVLGQIAVYRLPAGAEMTADPDEEADACAILRSVGEARIMAELLADTTPRILFVPEEFEKTYDGERGRRNYRLHLPDGFVSLHWGSDEDLRDVVATRFSRRQAGQILPVLILSHGKGANMPETASPLPCGIALLQLIDAANRFDSPLDEEDARLWSLGKPIRQDAPDDALDIHGTPPEVIEAAMALEEAGVVHEALLEAALESIRRGGTPGENPEREAAISKSPAIQYILVSTFRGKDVADALVEAASLPTP